MEPGRSVLLVDDSHSHGTFIARAFAHVEPSVSVVPVLSGEAAISFLEVVPVTSPLPSLVLLDREMPGGMDGFQTLLAIRSLPQLRDLAVLMISGSEDETHIERARIVGADGYALKPVDPTMYLEFVRRIHRWGPEKSWRNQAAGGPEALSKDDGSIDAPVSQVASKMHRGRGIAQAGDQAQILAEAAARAHLPLTLALDTRYCDRRVILRREKFVRLLMAWNWSNAEIQRFVPLNKYYLEHRRRELRGPEASVPM